MDRHGLGECLVCRGHAYVEFQQPGKSLEDWTAALNHLSLRRDPKPYYAALHNLAVRAVDHGTRQEAETAQENLKPALTLLNSYHRRHFAKYKLRWLIALTDARLGHEGEAELTFLEVRKGLARLKLPHEVGMISIDLALLYRKQGRFEKIKPLAEETTLIFQRLGVAAKVQEALDLWREADEREVSDGLLQRVRDLFANWSNAMPAPAT